VRNPRIRHLAILWLAAGGVCLSGCGTVVGMLNDQFASKIYVGIKQDLEILSSPEDEMEQALQPIAFFDFPVSLVLDTLLLPVTLLLPKSSPSRMAANGGP